MTCSPRSRACSYSAISSSDGGSGTSGPYSATRSAVAIPNWSSTCCSSCSIRSAAWALATSSRCSDSVTRGDLRGELGDLFTRLGQRADALVAFGGQCVATPGRDAHRGTQPLRQRAAGLGHRGRDRGGVFAGLPCALRPQPGLPFGRCGAAQRIRPPANGIRPLFGGAHGQPGLHLGGAGCLGRRDRFLALRGRGVEQRRLLGVVQSLLELGELLDGLHPPCLQLVALPDQPLPLLVGRCGRPGRACRAVRRSPRSRRRTR